MRRLATIALIAFTVTCHADRLITIPTARKVPFKTIRYELRFEPGEFGTRENLLAVGISPMFEMELRSSFKPTFENPGTFDFGYNYIAAIPGVSPGVSFGVQDADNVTSTGRRYYGVITFREPCDTMNGDFPADISIGMFAAGHWSPFVGVLIPFSKEFHLLAEDDGHFISAGFEFRSSPSLNFRFQVRNQQPLLSCQLTTHF